MQNDDFHYWNLIIQKKKREREDEESKEHYNFKLTLQLMAVNHLLMLSNIDQITFVRSHSL